MFHDNNSLKNSINLPQKSFITSSDYSKLFKKSEPLPNLKISRNSVIKKEKGSKAQKVFPEDFFFKNEENHSENSRIKNNITKNKVFNDLNSLFTKNQNENITKNNSPIYDSLLNTHKNFVILVNTKEFYNGKNILELKKEAFLDKFKPFIKKKVVLPSINKKSNEKYGATSVFDQMLITNMFDNNTNSKDPLEKDDTKAELTQEFTYNNVISTLATENSEIEIKIKSLENKGKDFQDNRSSEFKLPKINVKILDHKNIPKIKNASLLNSLEKEQLNAYCKLKKLKS